MKIERFHGGSSTHPWDFYWKKILGQNIIRHKLSLEAMTATQLTVDGPSRGGKEKTASVVGRLVDEIPNRFRPQEMCRPERKGATSRHGIKVKWNLFMIFCLCPRKWRSTFFLKWHYRYMQLILVGNMLETIF